MRTVCFVPGKRKVLPLLHIEPNYYEHFLWSPKCLYDYTVIIVAWYLIIVLFLTLLWFLEGVISSSEPFPNDFLPKKVKNISEMEWNSFVYFTVDKENGRAGETTSERESGRISLVSRALYCRAGGRGFDSRGRTNTQGLKITEK